ncbi:MAG TPA: glycosyltransferase family 4 protein, partial [Calditrichia bacterium]|nr:glycosyltransferase family 4 protein [Calditrichia bacterium]
GGWVESGKPETITIKKTVMNNQKLKVLFLSQRFLFPMDTGGKIRTGNILRQLSKRQDITVISNVESPRDDAYLGEMDDLCAKFIAVPWQEMPRYTLKFYLKLLWQSLSRYPISVLNDYSSELEAAVLEELATQKYDLAICDFLQSTLIFKNVEGVPRLLFQHNVEATITRRHLEKAGNPLARLFWHLQHRRMMRHEGEMCRDFDGTIAVSEKDKARMEEWFRAEGVFDIPTGVDTDFFRPSEAPEQKQLVFTGSMDWLPNEDAMIYFIKDIFPLIKQRERDTRLVIVGRRPTPALESLVAGREDIELTGWVEDTRPYIADSAVYIVPIRIGGGTRMKIYEALAMGKAMVSTSVGAEGLPLEHNKHILFADDAQRFAEHVIFLLNNPERRREIGAVARKYVYDHFRWERVAEVFDEICHRVAGMEKD